VSWPNDANFARRNGRSNNRNGFRHLRADRKATVLSGSLPETRPRPINRSPKAPALRHRLKSRFDQAILAI
jgi:hypothetical protein